MVDCGEGTQKQLRSAGINPLKLNAVFITHLHGDHVFGLFGLISTMGLMGRRTPLKVYAPRPFDEILANHLHYFDAALPTKYSGTRCARANTNCCMKTRCSKCGRSRCGIRFPPPDSFSGKRPRR
ncbi:MAG: MBL fold metallo-hydrolase [Alistipes indistinctus]